MMPGRDVYLSVIIPAYNESGRIEKTLRRVSEYLSAQPYSYEIIVVNDGSRDSTADAVGMLTKEVKNLSLKDRKENRGKGFSVKDGMLAAHGKIRLFMDADNATDISHFEKMRPFFDQGYDVVICSRDAKDAPGAEQAVKQSFFKRMLGNIGNLYIQLLAVRGIWDTQCGFKAFRDRAAEKIFFLTRINRWGFDVEILAIAREFRFRIGIIPAHWVNDPKTHVTLGGYARVLWEVFRIWRNLRKRVYRI